MYSTKKLSHSEQTQTHFPTHTYNQCRRLIGDLRDVVFVLLGQQEVLYCCNRCGRSSQDFKSFKTGHDCIKDKPFEYAEEDDRDLNIVLERTHSERDVCFYPAFSHEVAAALTSPSPGGGESAAELLSTEETKNFKRCQFCNLIFKTPSKVSAHCNKTHADHLKGRASYQSVNSFTHLGVLKLKKTRPMYRCSCFFDLLLAFLQTIPLFLMCVVRTTYGSG